MRVRPRCECDGSLWVVGVVYLTKLLAHRTNRQAGPCRGCPGADTAYSALQILRHLFFRHCEYVCRTLTVNSAAKALVPSCPLNGFGGGFHTGCLLQRPHLQLSYTHFDKPPRRSQFAVLWTYASIAVPAYHCFAWLAGAKRLVWFAVL